MRVLVAEDDSGLRSVLERGLREEGYVVDCVGNGDDALSYLRAYDYAVAVLDWRMPGRTGVCVAAETRQRGIRTPILMLTAMDTTSERVAGLDHGADDYLTKPFDFAELLARLRALQRRPALVHQPRLTVGQLVMDPTTHVVTDRGRQIALTAIEFSLLELMMRTAPAVATRRSIALHVWNEEADAVGSNTIEVHVARLRAKLPHGRSRIETVRGVGYRVVPE